jgi:hypothetical protein
MIYIIFLFFLLGLFQNNFINLINNFISFNFKNNLSLLKSIFHFFIYIFSFLFKYLFYLYLIYILYNFLNFYIYYDEAFINNIVILSFGTILGENLAKDMFKNKFLFTMLTLIPNQTNLNIFPYNLLPDMYLMNTCCIGLFAVILNIIIVEYIQGINILKYLPSIIKHSRIYFLIEFFFNRYIIIWNKSKKPILIISLICIIINLSLIQLGLYLIIHHNPY